MTYGAPTVNLSSGYYTDGAKVEDGKLTLPIKAVVTDKEGSIGTVKVKVTTQNYKDIILTIKVIAGAAEKTDPEYTAPTAKTLTYNGQALELINKGSATGGTMQYSLTSGSGYSIKIPTATNAGTYTVYYKVVGDATHNNVAELPLEEPEDGFAHGTIWPVAKWFVDL